MGRKNDHTGRKTARSVRSVAFANHTELKIDPGPVLPTAITLGDVDNDSNSELVVGCLNGTLIIYKGCQTTSPRYRCCLNESITCVTVGDIWGKGKNSIIVTVAEGQLVVFDISADENAKESPPEIDAIPIDSTGDVPSRQPNQRFGSHLSSMDESIDTEYNSEYTSKEPEDLKPSYVFECPCNIRACLLEDIYQIGSNVLILGTAEGSDSAVYVYRFRDIEEVGSETESMIEQYATWQVPGDVFSMSSCLPRSWSGDTSVHKPREPVLERAAAGGNRKENRTTRVLLIGLLHGEYGMIDPSLGNWVSFQVPETSSALQEESFQAWPKDSPSDGTTSGENYSATTSLENNKPVNFAGVPTLVIGGVASRGKLAPFKTAESGTVQNNSLDPQQPLGRAASLDSKSPSITSGGNVSVDSSSTPNEVEEELVVICSLGGYYAFYRLLASYEKLPEDSGWSVGASETEVGQVDGIVEPVTNVLDKNGLGKKGEAVMTEYRIEKVWEERTDSRTLALFAEDITGDNSREIVTCCWDGLTSVHDQEGNLLRFQFPGRVQAFLVGKLSVRRGVHDSCFVYVTFDGRIILYTNIAETIRAVPSRSITQELIRRKLRDRVVDVLSKSASKELKESFTEQVQGMKVSAAHKAYHAFLINECLYGQLRYKILQNRDLLKRKSLQEESSPAAATEE